MSPEYKDFLLLKTEYDFDNSIDSDIFSIGLIIINSLCDIYFSDFVRFNLINDD